MLSVGLTSCTADLDVNPIDPNLKTKVSPTDSIKAAAENIYLMLFIVTTL